MNNKKQNWKINAAVILACSLMGGYVFGMVEAEWSLVGAIVGFFLGIAVVFGILFF